MSLQIDLTKPLSDYEVQYLKDRGMDHALAENAAILKGKEFTHSEETAHAVLEQDTLEAANPTPPAEDIVDPVMEAKPTSRKK